MMIGFVLVRFEHVERIIESWSHLLIPKLKLKPQNSICLQPYHNSNNTTTTNTNNNEMIIIIWMILLRQVMSFAISIITCMLCLAIVRSPNCDAYLVDLPANRGNRISFFDERHRTSRNNNVRQGYKKLLHRQRQFAIPKDQDAGVGIAYTHLMKDLSTMKVSRISKFNKEVNLSNKDKLCHLKVTTPDGKKREMMMSLLSEHSSFCSLYYDGDNEKTNPFYFTNITSIVGPMHRRQVELMIYKHPKLMTYLLKNMENGNKLRSVQEQIIIDLKIARDGSTNDTEEIFRSKMKQKSSSISKLSRKNVRLVFHTFFNIGMDHTALQKVFLKAPHIFSYSNGNMIQTIQFLHSLELTNQDICKMIQNRPSVVTHSNKVGKKMDLIINFFRKDLNLDYRKIVVRYPHVFELKPEKLMPKAQLLMNMFKLHRWNDMSSILSTYPPILWLSNDTIELKVQFLVREFELDDDELREILVTYPQILGLSLENNLQPKVDYFTLELSRQHFKEMVMYQPALLAYSLDGRIKPRILILKENSISFCYAPPYLMSLSDVKFNQWLETQRSTWSIT